MMITGHWDESFEDTTARVKKVNEAPHGTDLVYILNQSTAFQRGDVLKKIGKYGVHTVRCETKFGKLDIACKNLITPEQFAEYVTSKLVETTDDLPF